jgi:hypothetical protein
MKKSKKTGFNKPMTHEMMQMANEKLMNFLQEQKFGSIDEANAFIKEHINGKRIDEVVPAKKAGKSDLERSDDLMYEAYDCEPATGIRLAKEALVLNPENIRSITYLGEQEKNVETACKLFKQALDIGAKRFGGNFLKENKGHFWLIQETRPYMTAKLNYATCLSALDRTGEAIKEYYEMLKLNPGDNQGVRYTLGSLLLYDKKYAAFHELYDKYRDEESASWYFNYALYLFATEGPTGKSNRALFKANKANKHIIPYLTANKKIESQTDGYYSPGDEREAVYYLMDNFRSWKECPGTIDWLMNFIMSSKHLS